MSTITLHNAKFTEFLTSVDADMGRDTNSLNLFEWVIEEYYDDKIKENKAYFTERPGLLKLNMEQIFWELDTMLNYFIKKEEYEKCARIKAVEEEFRKI